MLAAPEPERPRNAAGKRLELMPPISGGVYPTGSNFGAV